MNRLNGFLFINPFKLTKQHEKQILIFTAVVCGMTCTTTAYAQFKIGGKKINVGKVVQAGTDAAKAITLSDADIAAMSREYMQWMDTTIL